MKKYFEEFKQFINRGNIVDLAIGVVVGSSFSKIVTSVVNDLIMPLVGILLGGLDFTNLSLQIKDSKIMYGSLIQNVIDFLIIALCVFTMVKLINKITKKEEKKKEVKEEKKKDEQILLLEEIRDLLKEDKKEKKKQKKIKEKSKQS